MTHVTCRLTAKNRDQLRNPTLGNRVWATFTFTYSTYIQGGRKNLRVDNFATVRGRKACDMSKVSKFCLQKKYETKMSVKLNICCVVCINIQRIWNYAAFDNDAWILPHFSLKETVLVTIKQLKLCPKCSVSSDSCTKMVEHCFTAASMIRL